MKAAIYRGPSKHQSVHADAMALGLSRHGINYEFFMDYVPPADFIVTWGWRKGQLFHARGQNVLVMERGYLGDRFAWTSLGWNGLNGNAEWNDAHDTGERFEKHYSSLVKPWKRQDGYALIIGQVAGDMSLAGIDQDAWSIEAASRMAALGFDIRYRQHPIAASRNMRSPLPNMEGSLDDALRGAAVVVTYNSNTGVDAGINGVPVITLNQGSMARSISAHSFTADLITPAREQWLTDLAWRQWSLEEIEDGTAWEYVKRSDVKSVERTVLVLGGGKSVWEDAEKAFALGKIDVVIAINNCIQDYPGKVDAALTLHPNKLDAWLNSRKEKGYPEPFTVIGHRPYKNVTKVLNYQWPDWSPRMSGSSGLFAVKAAFELYNANKVILAGVPMSIADAHYHNERPWNDASTFLPAWLHSMPRLQNKVKSFNGWTADKLGVPTKEWVNG